MVLYGGAVSTTPKTAAGLPPMVDHPRLFYQYIYSYPPYWKLFLHPQPEEEKCLCDTDPHHAKYLIFEITLKSIKSVLLDFQDFNILILFFNIIYGKDSSGCIQYRNFLVS
jgi:hypothetical protein